MSPLCFLDTETTGVHPGRKVWEIAMIRRDNKSQREIQFFVDVDLRDADPFGLKVGGFYERHPVGRYLSGLEPGAPEGSTWSQASAAEMVAVWTHGAHIVGAVPNFDTESLDKLLRAFGRLPAWHHRLRCVETLTAGYLGREIGGLSDCAKELGIEVDPAAVHTAMGDARTAMQVYDRIVAGVA